LFEVLCGEDAGFRKIEERLPEIHTHRGVAPILPGDGRLIKTHEPYRSDYKKAVLLIRDVRDIFLSVYSGFGSTGMIPIVSKGDMDSFLLSFLQGRALPMGSWQEHSRSWLESPLARGNDLLIVRYEELRATPEQKIGEILRFLGTTPNVKVIRQAIENNNLQRMRMKEEKAKKAKEGSILLGDQKSERTRSFVGKGSVGGWRDQLTEAQVQLIEQYAGEMLLTAGYEIGAMSKAAC
jgi:hypothetical protein